ncbi:MAG: MFS transporter, partial [Microbacterium sp.]
VWGAPAALLLVAATLIGTVSAFHRPAVGVFPRLFVDDDSLGAAMARAGTAGQLARTVAPPLGGLLIGLIALSGVALMDALGCLAMLATLLAVRPPRGRPPAPGAVTFRGIAEGISSARTTRGVPALLGAVAIVAGAVIPAVVLGIPLAARERGWTAAEAGLIEAGWIAGGLLAGFWFAWRGTSPTAWRPMALGPLVVAAGLGILAAAPGWILAASGTLVVGVGVVVFTAHVFPTYVLLAPPPMVSRFQSLLILAQQAPQLIANPLIGIVVAAAGTGPMIAASRILAVAAALVVARDRTLRADTRPDAC